MHLPYVQVYSMHKRLKVSYFYSLTFLLAVISQAQCHWEERGIPFPPARELEVDHVDEVGRRKSRSTFQLLRGNFVEL